MQDWILERYSNIRAKLGIASVSSDVSTHDTQTPITATQPIITTNHAQPHVVVIPPINTTNHPVVVNQSSDMTPLPSTPIATPSFSLEYDPFRKKGAFSDKNCN
jgi:hypothetical protein